MLYKQTSLSWSSSSLKHRSIAKSCTGLTSVVVQDSPVLSDITTRSLTSPALPQHLSLSLYFTEIWLKAKSYSLNRKGTWNYCIAFWCLQCLCLPETFLQSNIQYCLVLLIKTAVWHLQNKSNNRHLRIYSIWNKRTWLLRLHCNKPASDESKESKDFLFIEYY